MNALNLIVLGPQGSGKSTQAELLARTPGFALIGAGDVLREIARENTELGRKVHQTINVEGRLVAPESISEVMKEKIARVPRGQGLILDGYPRSLEQYELFKRFWPETGRGDYRIVLIDVSDDEAVRRLARRMTCDNCGATCVEGTGKTCAECGGSLVRRLDDTPPAIRKRLESFDSETMPMIRAMEADGKVLHIDGTPSIDEVHGEILAKISR
jgi:adenylate kinase